MTKRAAGKEPGLRMTLQVLMVLRHLLAAPTEPRYGLELAEATSLPTGTVYPILARLERAGWVSSCWEAGEDAAAAQRPRRRLYAMTGHGATAAREALGSVAEATSLPSLLSLPGRRRREADAT